MRTCFLLLLPIAFAHTHGADADELPSIPQLAGIIRDQRLAIRDYECLYEGRQIWITSAETTGMPQGMRIATENSPDMKAGYTTSYQGKFAFRADEALHQDISVSTSFATEPMRRSISTFLRGKVASRAITPDRGGVLGPDTSGSNSIIFAANQTTSMVYIDRTPVLQAVLNFREGLEMTDAAWEEVDGHRCLAFNLGRGYKGEPPVLVERYWVDLARNAAVLKLEVMAHGMVASTLDGIHLERDTTLDGQTVWFPHTAQIQWYNVTAAPRTPYLKANFGILDGTLKINQDLTDDRFSLDHGLALKEIKDAHDFNSGARVVEGSRGATNAVDALKKSIPDVDNPAKRLSAQPNSSSWLGNYAGYLLVACGAVVLTASFLLRRRTR